MTRLDATCHGRNFSSLVSFLFLFFWFASPFFVQPTDAFLFFSDSISPPIEKSWRQLIVLGNQGKETGIYCALRARSSSKSDDEGLGVPKTKGGLSGVGILMGCARQYAIASSSSCDA